MVDPLPGCALGSTVTPATLPWIASTAFAAGTGAFSASTLPTVNGTRVPLVGSTTPVVTTASSVSGAGDSLRSAVAEPPDTRTLGTVSARNPSRRTSSVYVPSATPVSV